MLIRITLCNKSNLRVFLDCKGNLKKVQHLLDLPNAKTQLTLWKADLSDEGSYDDAINGCDGVFHIATPMDFESKDPEVIELYCKPFNLFILNPNKICYN